ncbi:MAG TPA: glutathione S-transferase family protein [Solirubrobacterales bacterium]|jgi:glutathione S-transferase|nr:glutathione S-transferase family protein [Solirubrobacterales bacterium]
MSATKPTLWHIPVSHYSEKVRWALDHKRVDHVRRAPIPGTHIPIALWLTHGASMTFPVLQVDGRALGDSTAIVAALEELRPEPPLYPADPDERARALALEEFFDEELGPHARLLVFHELIDEPDVFAELASRTVPGPLSQVKSLTGAYARIFTSLRYGAQRDDAAAAARVKVLAALERLEAELAAADGDYLVGDRFSVADLTAAALFYPVVDPDEGPLPPGTPTPAAIAAFRASLAERPGVRWVKEMFRRHRRPARAPLTAAAEG